VILGLHTLHILLPGSIKPCIIDGLGLWKSRSFESFPGNIYRLLNRSDMLKPSLLTAYPGGYIEVSDGSIYYMNTSIQVNGSGIEDSFDPTDDLRSVSVKDCLHI
jgi:hypothetical protein